MSADLENLTNHPYQIDVGQYCRVYQCDFIHVKTVMRDGEELED